MFFVGVYGMLLPRRQHDGAVQVMETKPTILILASPGNFQTSLQTLLSLLNDVAVLVTGEGTSVMQIIEKHIPSLVILDFDLPGENMPIVAKRIKERWPNIPCLVLVDNEQQRQQAKGTGVDLVLVKGYPASKLITAIEGLLSQESR
jgi:DNA-binding NarL/FixJ family response regulator